MNPTRDLSRRDLERLSAYLDGELPERQAARLEARLEREPDLRRGLQALRATRGVLRSLPELRAPRDFTLSPDTVGARGAGWSLFPVFRMATAIAAAALALVVGLDVLSGRVGPVADRGMAEAPALEEPAAALEMEAEPSQAPDAFALGEAPAEEAEEQAEKTLDEGLPAPSARAALPTMTACPECTPEPALAEVEPEEGTPPTPSPSRTPAPEAARSGEEQAVGTPTAPPSPTPEPSFLTEIALPPLRIAEIALGAAVILFAGLAFYTRRTR